MDLKSAIIESIVELFQMFGLNSFFKEDVYEKHQFWGEQVNILIGFTEGIKGNVIIGLKKTTACKIVSAMMGGVEINELDFMAKSALGEFANMTLGSAVVKLNWDEIINLSPPTVATGEDMSITVAGNNAVKLNFDLNGENFSVIIATE